MTQSLLLEIGLEELPAQYVRTSSEQLAKRVEDFFKDENLEFESVEAFATPRRLAVRVNGLVEEQADREEIFKGPSLAIAQKDGAWTKAAEGFVRGKGLTTDDIYVEEVNGVEYIHVKQHIAGKSTKEVVKNLSSVITDMKFPVTMRWAAHTFEYLRPIHWIVALYGNEVIEEIGVLDVKAGRVSRGHRFLGKEATIEKPESYEKALAEQFVIVNQDERKALVRKQIEELAAKNNWIIPIDEDLLEEVSSILEYPTAFAGTFDEKYLVVPKEDNSKLYQYDVQAAFNRVYTDALIASNTEKPEPIWNIIIDDYENNKFINKTINDKSKVIKYLIQYNVLEEAQDINPDFFTNDVNNIIEFIQTNDELFITKSEDAELIDLKQTHDTITYDREPLIIYKD